MKQILIVIKEVLMSYYPERSLIDSMMKYDFKSGDVKTNLMQLCFSNLASWPLILILFYIANDPFKDSWSLIRSLSFTNPIVLFLLNGLWVTMLIVFVIFFVLQWVFRKEYLFLALIFYFTSRSEIHVNLAVIAALAVYLSRISYLFWMATDCVSETKKIWKAVSTLQLLAWAVVLIMAMTALDYLQVNHLFNEKTEMNRFNFLAIIVLSYHIFSHLFLSLWGHFYVQKKQDPSVLNVYYSTAYWILRFNISYHLQSLLKLQISELLEKHNQNDQQFKELKKQAPGLSQFNVEETLRKEILHLNEAKLRLSKI